MAVETPSRNGNDGASGPAAFPDPPLAGSGVELRERLDQVGVILAKGLDLAEAGVGLGMTILNRVSFAAQQKLREGLEAAAQPQPDAPDAAADPAGVPVGDSDQPFSLTNRLPLTPGGEVTISFSVNNDSMTEARKVAFGVQGFAGDSRRAALDASVFSIKPPSKAIAPVDFEKFVLKGVVPETLPPDVYRGVVVVHSDKDLFIPVVLVVTPTLR